MPALPKVQELHRGMSEKRAVEAATNNHLHLRRHASCAVVRDLVEGDERRREDARMFHENRVCCELANNCSLGRQLAQLVAGLLGRHGDGGYGHVVTYTLGMAAPWLCALLAHQLGLDRGCVLPADGLDMRGLVEATGKEGTRARWNRGCCRPTTSPTGPRRGSRCAPSC